MKKEHIATLFRQLSFFKPELTAAGGFTGTFLVNQIGVDKAKAAQAHKSALHTQMIPPDRDTLLDLIGKAGMEMKEFIAEIDQSAMGNEIMMRHLKELDSHMNAMLGDAGNDLNPLEKMEMIQGRYEQMAGFVSDVALSDNDGIPTKIYKTANFLNDKINKPNAKKEEAPVVGPVQPTQALGPENTDPNYAGSAANIRLFTPPSDVATGGDSVGSSEEPKAKDTEGLATQDPDKS